jgi:NAD-dependent deacetylase
MAEAKAAGIRTCEINLEPSDNAHRFDERRYGSAGEVVPAWAEDILASMSTSRFASLTATSPKRQA